MASTPPPNDPQYPPQGPQFPQAPNGPYIDFGAISLAWKYIQADLGMWVVCSLVVIMLVGIINVPFSIVRNLLSTGHAGIVVGKQQPISIPNFGPAWFFRTALSTSIGWVGGIFGNVLTVGFQYMALKRIRGYALDLSDMFTVLARNFLPILTTAILISIISGIGYMLCIIPGIYAGLVLSFAPLIAADQGVDGVEAIKRSHAALKGKALSWFGVLFVTSLCMLLGLLGCCIGILVTYGLLPLVVALHYNGFFPYDPNSEGYNTVAPVDGFVGYYRPPAGNA